MSNGSTGPGAASEHVSAHAGSEYGSAAARSAVHPRSMSVPTVTRLMGAALRGPSEVGVMI